MAGKYHRSYLREDIQSAFEKMQKETGKASNAYIVAAVKTALVADGYMAEARTLNGDMEQWRQAGAASAGGAPAEPVVEAPRRRRRRAPRG